MRRPLLSLLALSFALAIAGPAAASDGVLEISRTCAIQTGCFPGDAPGLPVTITMPGAAMKRYDSWFAPVLQLVRETGESKPSRSEA